MNTVFYNSKAGYVSDLQCGRLEAARERHTGSRNHKTLALID